MRRYLKVLCFVGVLAIVAAACGGDGGGGGGPPAPPTEEIPRGGIIQGGMIGDVIAAFDPQKEYYSVTWEYFHCCLVRNLMSYNGKPTGEGGTELHPDLAAAEPEVSADGLTWTFTLKAGIHYAPPLQDVEITSGDFARALVRETNPKANVGGYSFYYSIIKGFDDAAAAWEGGQPTGIEGVTTPDDATLVIELNSPSGDLGFLMAMPAAAPIPPNGDALLGVAEGHDKDYGRFLVATGPYMFTGSEALDFSLPADQQTPASGYVPGRSIELVRNPSWDPATDDLRPAYVDGFSITIGGDSTDLYNKVDAGELDIVVDSGPPPELLQKYSTDPTLQDRLHTNPSDAVRYLSFNLGVPPFDDVHVRKAVNLAVDKAGLRQLRGGPLTGEIAGHIMVNSLQADILKAYDPYASPNSAGDIDAAKAEMALSAYDSDGDGVCDDPVCDGILVVTDESAPYPEQDALIQQNLEPLGLILDVKAFDRGTMYSKCNNPADQVAFCTAPGWGKDYPDAVTFGPPLFGSVSIFPSCCNYSLVGASADLLAENGYTVTSVQSVDDAMAACAPLTGDERVQCWADVDTLLMEEVVPWVPYLFDNNNTIASERVVNFSFDQFAGLLAMDHLAIAADLQ
ncbi:MAG: ABC transporter substrate-binding protein [Actinomycetota bacterium]